MEMNEGYQDREDPGLTVRFPLRRPARRGAARLDDDAVDADLERRGGGRAATSATSGSARATTRSGSARARSRRRSRARSRSSRRSPGASWSAGATRARSTTCRRSGRRSRRARATTRDRAVRASGRRLERGRRGRGDRHRPHRPGLRRRGLPARQGARPAGRSRRSTRAASFVDGFGSLTGRDVRDVAEPIVEHLKREGRFYRLEPYIHRYPHCWRCGTPLVFRLVDEWFISMGPVYDQPRETLTAGAGRREPALPDHGDRRPDPLDPGLRLRARARLAPEHARLDDQQEALLGPGAADLRLPGVRDVRGHRRPRGAPASGRSRAGRRSRATRRTGRTSTRSRSPARGCGAPVERIKDVGNPWLDAGIVPFSTLHYREDPDYWAQWFPADFITESFPGQFRNWFYSMLAMSHGPPPRAAVQDDLRLRARSSARTAGRCTRAGATRSSSTRPPSGWASTSCAGCSPRRGPRRTSCSAGTPPTRRGASCSSSGTSTRSS